MDAGNLWCFNRRSEAAAHLLKLHAGGFFYGTIHIDLAREPADNLDLRDEWQPLPIAPSSSTAAGTGDATRIHDGEVHQTN